MGKEGVMDGVDEVSGGKAVLKEKDCVEELKYDGATKSMRMMGDRREKDNNKLCRWRS